MKIRFDSFFNKLENLFLKYYYNDFIIILSIIIVTNKKLKTKQVLYRLSNWIFRIILTMRKKDWEKVKTKILRVQCYFNSTFSTRQIYGSHLENKKDVTQPWKLNWFHASEFQVWKFCYRNEERKVNFNNVCLYSFSSLQMIFQKLILFLSWNAICTNCIFVTRTAQRRGVIFKFGA